MQTVRFEKYIGAFYFVYYKSLPIGLLTKINKNKWGFSPFLMFKSDKYIFKSLNDAKRFVRIQINDFDCFWRQFVKKFELNNLKAMDVLKKDISQTHEVICNAQTKIFEANE
jgi:hypothetical protein